ncbi:MAG: carbonic anhydrase [Thermodesulfobacteriota bacterium]|nr:carbonic anhydrase [Thermodesulfobacteriota bacterium]
MIHQSAITDFCQKEYSPEVDSSACIHPVAAVIGHVFIGKRVMVSPFASVRGDEGRPIFVGDESNVQDGVILHALETEHNGHPIEENQVEAGGKKYSVYVGERVSLAHQVQIHGPAYVGDDTFVGMKTLVFRAKVGNNCVIEPGCIVMGVTVEDGRYVPAGTVLRAQKDADNLPVVTDDYPLKNLNKGVVHVNTSLADGYNKINLK